MKNFQDIERGFREMIKESLDFDPVHIGANVGNTIGGGYNTIQQGLQDAHTLVGAAQNPLAALAPVLPLAVGAMGMMGGGGQAAPAPAQPVQQSFLHPANSVAQNMQLNKPIAPAGMKFGNPAPKIASEKRAIVGGMLVGKALESLTQPTEQPTKVAPTMGSKDPKVEKALENPAVRAYIDKLMKESGT